MNCQARLSLVSKGCFAAAVVMLLGGAERPEPQPFSPAAQETVERIRMFDAQPVGTMQSGPEPRSIDYAELRSDQRWVF